VIEFDKSKGSSVPRCPSSDGRRLEYFVRNGGRQVAIVNVVCTACTSRLYHVWRPESILPHLEEHSVSFVNVSAAGVGPSEPYGDWLGGVNVMEYLERTTEDIIALLKHLGVREVYTMGVSGGWTPSVCLATKLVGTEELRLLGVCCISGIPWQTQTENFWEKSMGTGCTFALSTRLLESRIAPYMMNSLSPIDQEKTIKFFTEDARAALGPELAREFVRDMNRSSAYYLFVAAFLGRLTTNSKRSRLPESHADLTKQGSEIPVHLHMSTEDKMVPTERVVTSSTNAVPHATHFSNSNSHLVPPVELAITEILKTSLSTNNET